MSTLLEEDGTLRDIVDRLVRAVNPDKLVVFGSRGTGHARADSDYDILIVKAEADPRRRRTGPLYQALWGVPRPVDLLWYTPEEIEEWSAVRQHVATQALKSGVVVYEKNAG